MIALTALASEIDLVYIEPGFSAFHVEKFEVNDDPIESIFSKLSNPPHGYLSFVPPNVLRTYFILEDTIVLDLKKKPLEGLDFDGERYFLYQILSSIFLSFDFENVKIIIDGKDSDVLVSEVDLRFSFTRSAWIDWIEEMIR